MKRILLLAPLALLLSQPSRLQAAPRRPPVGWKSFDGPLFSVYYPAKWKAQSGKSSQDAALFSSPTGSAQFAVYSPQWNGEPTDLNFNAHRERRISCRVQKSRAHDAANSQLVSRWQTFAALDHSYTRSIVDVENVTLNTRRVFGFRYKNAAAYQKFLPTFKVFKASLEQYSD